MESAGESAQSRARQLMEEGRRKGLNQSAAKFVAKETMNDPKEKIKRRATVILHNERKKAGLSIVQYCVADLIYFFGNGNKSRIMGGWSFVSKQHIADNLDISKRSVEYAINDLISGGWVEKQEETKHLRTTDKWYNAIEAYKSKD